MKPGFEIEAFYDGGCPLCRREVAWIRRFDRGGRIRFTDIDDPHFDPALYGKTLGELMAQMHGRLPDGRWITGVEVFRRLYAAAGFRWLVAATRWPVISQAMDLAYGLFARNRLKWTGRCREGDVCSVGRGRSERVS